MPCHLRYFFDTGSGVCLWAANDRARGRFGYAVALDDLPLSENTRRWLLHLVAWHDTAIDWSAPPQAASGWTAEEAQRFQAAADRGLALLRQDLPAPDWQVIDDRPGPGTPSAPKPQPQAPAPTPCPAPP